MTSQEKLNQLVEEMVGQAAPAFQVIARPMLSQLKLPEDPKELDEQLVHYARMLLQLRSDDACPMFIAATADVEVNPDVAITPAPAELAEASA
jgi:hypothetical protein